MGVYKFYRNPVYVYTFIAVIIALTAFKCKTYSAPPSGVDAMKIKHAQQIAQSIRKGDDTIKLKSIIKVNRRVYSPSEVNTADQFSSSEYWVYPIDSESSFFSTKFQSLVAGVSGSVIDTIYIETIID